MVGSRPRPLPWPVGACARPSRGRRGAPLPARCAAWGRRRAGWRSFAAPPWGGPPLPGPSGPPWLALAALRAALRGVGRPAAAAGSPLRAFPPGFGPRSSAPGGRWPAARACWAALRPPGWRSRAGAPWAIRPMVRWRGGSWRGAQAYKGNNDPVPAPPWWAKNPGVSHLTMGRRAGILSLQDQWRLR